MRLEQVTTRQPEKLLRDHPLPAADDLRDEFLDRTVFENVADAKAQADAFKREFNTVRPHSALSYKTPREFAASCKAAAEKTKTKNPRGRKTAN
jgi:transposase InsO family protein